MSFPYEWINKDNLDNKELLEIKDFYSSLKLDTISKEEYKQTKEIYDKLEFKDIKEYLDTYLKLDRVKPLVLSGYLILSFCSKKLPQLRISA